MRSLLQAVLKKVLIPTPGFRGAVVQSWPNKFSYWFPCLRSLFEVQIAKGEMRMDGIHPGFPAHLLTNHFLPQTLSICQSLISPLFFCETHNFMSVSQWWEPKQAAFSMLLRGPGSPLLMAQWQEMGPFSMDAFREVTFTFSVGSAPLILGLLASIKDTWEASLSSDFGLMQAHYL